ncbi:hypothetical protein [Bacillus sp. SM2101]|uniref:globin domain-containing protein n=1 Tax=Bacillus sp. SM2101 TaxID=2805366 RepID=UPI001BDEAA08|nr:hypothetical protein [Bacillus sp. SM2101]
MANREDLNLNTEKIKELVEVFYQNLLQEQYFKDTFNARGVDLNLLKSRQQSFILALMDETEVNANHQQQVQTRHPFNTTPENAQIWIRVMEESMEEISLDETIKSKLLTKMHMLMKTIVRG